MLRKILLLSVAPFIAFAMDNDASLDGQLDIAHRDVLIHHNEEDANLEQINSVIAPLLQAEVVQPQPLTIVEVIEALNQVYRSADFPETQTLLLKHSEILMTSKEGVALGLKASVFTDQSNLFHKFMTVADSALKPDLNTINLALYLAASEGRLLYINSLFSYRYEIPIPDSAGVDRAFVLAAQKGHADFMDALYEEVGRDTDKDYDWLTKPTYKTSAHVILTYALAAYYYNGFLNIH